MGHYFVVCHESRTSEVASHYDSLQITAWLLLIDEFSSPLVIEPFTGLPARHTPKGVMVVSL